MRTLPLAMLLGMLLVSPPPSVQAGAGTIYYPHSTQSFRPVLMPTGEPVLNEHGCPLRQRWDVVERAPGVVHSEKPMGLPYGEEGCMREKGATERSMDEVIGVGGEVEDAAPP